MVLRYGVVVDTASNNGPSPIMATGANAAIASYGSVGCVAAAVRKLDEVSSNIDPSCGALATASVAYLLIPLAR